MREWWDDERILDTLRLSLDEYSAIVSQLATDGDGRRGTNHRRHPRLRYWNQDLAVRLQRQNRASIPYRVKAHNISARGVAFLNGFFIQTGTPCDAALRNVRGGTVSLSGKVARCRYVGGKTHEIGMEFDRLIELREFLPEDVLPVSQEIAIGGSERFSGKLLYVDDSLDGQELISFLAGELGVEVQTAASTSEATGLVRNENFDLVMVKITPGHSAGELARGLRESNYSGFIAAVSGQAAGVEQATEADALARGCNCVLSAPVTPERLTDLFSSVLIGKEADSAAPEPLFSSLWPNVKMRPLILKFVARLQTRVAELEGLLSAEQQGELRRMCQESMDSAESYGYKQIAGAFRELLALVAEQAHLEQLKDKVEELNRLCTAAGLVHAE